MEEGKRKEVTVKTLLNYGRLLALNTSGGMDR